jgi:hypothetical protein
VFNLQILSNSNAESPEVMSMSKKGRQKMTGEVILELLLGAARRQSKVMNIDGYYAGIAIVVRNSHLMDTKSIKIFDKLSEHLDKTSLWLAFSISSGTQKLLLFAWVQSTSILVTDLDPTLARLV